MKRFVGLILAMLLLGCAPAVKLYDISVIPSYDRDAVNAQWEQLVTPLDEKSGDFTQLLMLGAMYGVTVGDPAKKKIQSLYDEFIYYHAVTEVKVYHSDPSAKDSAAKAESAINAAVELLGSELIQKAGI